MVKTENSMKTLKRIGLFLLLKVLEILGLFLVCALIIGYVLLIRRYLIIGLIIMGIWLIFILPGIIEANWNYVKRKIK